MLTGRDDLEEIKDMGYRINLEDAKRLYFDEGLSLRGTASRLGISRSGLRYRFAKAQLTLRKQDVNIEEAKRLYYNEGLSIALVATRLNISRSALMERFRKASLHLRSHGEATRLAHKQGRRKLSKGGRIINNHGYIEVMEPQHPRAKGETGYVLEHILVWEKVHNRPLPKGWVIHHLNGIKTDNRPYNLAAMPRAKHTRRELGEPYKKRIRELEAEVNLLRKALEDSQAIFYIGEN